MVVGCDQGWPAGTPRRRRDVELLDRHRVGVKEALPLVAAEPCQCLGLRRRLDALGGHAQVQGMSEVYDASNQAGAGLLGDAVSKRLVNLDPVDG